MRLMHHKKAARVLPLPVGARISADSPREIAGQPVICGGGRSRKDCLEPIADGEMKEFECVASVVFEHGLVGLRHKVHILGHA